MSGPGHLYDEAVTFWPRAGVTAGGDAAFGAPVTVLGRWMDSEELVTTPSGDQVGSTSSVMVDHDLKLEDRVVRGTSAAAAPDDAFAMTVIARRVAKRPGGALVVRRFFLR